MKENIDLTENRDFRDHSTEGTVFQPPIFPHWTDSSLLRPDQILKEAGIRTLSGHENFPPIDRCEVCGKTIAPWSEERGLCKKCYVRLIINSPSHPKFEHPMSSDTTVLFI